METNSSASTMTMNRWEYPFDWNWPSVFARSSSAFIDPYLPVLQPLFQRVETAKQTGQLPENYTVEAQWYTKTLTVKQRTQRPQKQQHHNLHIRLPALLVRLLRRLQHGFCPNRLEHKPHQPTNQPTPRSSNPTKQNLGNNNYLEKPCSHHT